MTRPAPKPRTIQDVLAEVHAAFDKASVPWTDAKPLPAPPPDAPLPPTPFHERVPGEDDDQP